MSKLWSPAPLFSRILGCESEGSVPGWFVLWCPYPWGWWIAWGCDHGWVSSLILFLSVAFHPSPTCFRQDGAFPFLGLLSVGSLVLLQERRWISWTCLSHLSALDSCLFALFSEISLTLFQITKLLFNCVLRLLFSCGNHLNFHTFSLDCPAEVMAAWK